MDLRQLVQAFLIDRRSMGCSPKTIEWHEVILTLFIDWLTQQGHTNPAAWTSSIVNLYMVHLQDRTTARGRPLSRTSINSYAGSIIAFLRWLYLEEFIDKNIADRVHKPSRPKLVKDPFSADELHALLRVAKDTRQGLRDVAIFSVLLDCGLRAGELTSLRLDDVNLKQGRLVVHYGKGAKGRIVPFSVETAKAINRYLLKARESETPYVFVGEQGQPLEPNAVRLLVQRLAKKAGIPDATAHRFRRTFAVNFLRNGGNLYDLQLLMGHEDITITRMYLSADEQALKEAHDLSSPMLGLTTARRRNRHRGR